MAALHWLWAITCIVSFLAAVVASDTLRALLWPCSHMHFAVQVIGESHSGVVRTTDSQTLATVWPHSGVEHTRLHQTQPRCKLVQPTLEPRQLL